MGKHFLGFSENKQLDLFNPQQKQFLNSVLGVGENQGINALSGFLQGPNQGQLDDVFQKAYLNPAMTAFNEELVPTLQAQFADSTGGQSSALNRALAKAATGLAGQLGSQYGGLYQQGTQNQMDALKLLGSLSGQKTFENYQREVPGLAGEMIKGLAQAAPTLATLSSILVKEDIEPYESTDELMDDINVYRYRYKGEDEEKIGFIAEMMPEEVVVENEEGILCVDVYGTLALAVNAIKALRHRVNLLQNHVRSMNGYMQNYLDYDEALADEYADEMDDDFYYPDAE